MRLKSTLSCILASMTMLVLNPIPSFAESPKNLHVFLLAGQSNMAGRAPIESQDKGRIPGTFLWNIATKQWEPATAPLNRYSPQRKGMNMQRLNCGPSFAKVYRKANPGVEIGIVCVARGGTAIREWAKDRKKPFPMYASALSATEAAVKASLEEGGELKGILWHQGESDAGQLDGYAETFAKLVSTFREDLRRPDLPFVFGQIGQWNPDYKAFNEQIVKQAAKIPHSACVRTDGLTNMDRAHFDAKSQRMLGERYAEALMNLTK